MHRPIAALAFMLVAGLAGPGETTEQDDWLGIAGDLEAIETALVRAEVTGEHTAPVGLPLEMRSFCAKPVAQFAVELIGQACDEADCSGDRNRLAALAADSRRGTEAGMAAARQADALLFVSNDSSFPARPSKQEEMPFRAAADLWLRSRSDAMTTDAMARPGPARDEFLILMRAWCGLATRNREAAASWVTAQDFPSDATGDGRRQVAALVYIAQHAAFDLGSVSALRNAAGETFSEGRLSAYYMAQLLDVERTAYDGKQVLGHLTDCDGGRAYFSPPLADLEAADRWRTLYGLPPTTTYLARTSARCPVNPS